MTRAARAQLREQTAGREPTLEELARAVLGPRLRQRLLSQLKAEPTATQLQAGWRKYMPEFRHRIEENVEFVKADDQITHAASLDRGLRGDDDRTLYDVVGSSQQSAPVFPGDGPSGPALANHLKAVLDRVGLSERAQFVLRHHFGIMEYAQLSTEEIAARQGISEEAVSEIVASAVAQLQRSSEALTLLIPYLRL